MTKLLTANKIALAYDPALTSWHNVHNFLKEARRSGKEEKFAYHLIGASLQNAFPDIEIYEKPYNIDPDEMEAPRTFSIGDTFFYVSSTPLKEVLENCRQDLEDGYSVYLLVPERVLAAARLNAELMAPGRITAESIESFVGQTTEELSSFLRDKLKTGFRRLLETYNERVDAAETDRSMLVEIPRNL